MLALDLASQLEALITLSIIAILALKFRLLDGPGVAASIPIGYITIVFAGLRYFLILLAFFTISSLATRFRVKILGEGFIEKDWVRGWRNVLANGLASTFIIIAPLFFSQLTSQLMTIGFLGALGTAFADTLATEMGLLSRHEPRMITNLRRVEKGTPGAVTLYGYLGSMLALLILCSLAWILQLADQLMILITIIAGILGTTIDSLLGAGLQQKYRCTVCGRIVENPKHCDKPAEKYSGISWINTHIVNLLSTSMGAMIAMLLYILLA